MHLTAAIPLLATRIFSITRFPPSLFFSSCIEPKPELVDLVLFKVRELRRPMVLEEGFFIGGWLLFLSSMLVLLFVVLVLLVLVLLVLIVSSICSNILFRLSDEDFVDDKEAVLESIELWFELSGYDGR